jgi:hypothetical protein
VKSLPLRGIALALAVWFAGMTLAALVVEPDAVVAFGPQGRLLRATVDADGALLTAWQGFVALRTGKADTVRQLYKSGAWLVWPVLGAGCRRNFF